MAQSPTDGCLPPWKKPGKQGKEVSRSEDEKKPTATKIRESAKENLFSDCIRGCFVVACTLCAFISLVWLREQIITNGGPAWLEPNADPLPQLNVINNDPGGGAENAAAEGGGGGENVNQPQDIPEEEGNNGANQDAENGAQNDDANWNPVEWERAAEELTWERMLGLDGSLVFLEHVFWVVSLNTSFILVFAFCPFHIGQFTVILLSLEEVFQSSKFEGLLTAVLGYVIIAFSLILCHSVASVCGLRRPKRILGLCYVVVKVSLLLLVEIGLFPLVCGWWLDVCSLSLFGATLKDRLLSVDSAPGTAMFLHWLVGMVYVFYFASFVLLLREVLRPGVLWFLQGSYGSWKTWKVMEFRKKNSRPGKSWNFDQSHGKSWKIVII